MPRFASLIWGQRHPTDTLITAEVTIKAMSTVPAPRGKASTTKPVLTDGLPLWPHPPVVWCKKNKGKFRSFGKAGGKEEPQAGTIPARTPELLDLSVLAFSVTIRTTLSGTPEGISAST